MDFPPQQCYLNTVCDSDSKMDSLSLHLQGQLRAQCFVLVHWVALKRTRWKGYKDVTAVSKKKADLLSTIYILKVLCIVLVSIPLL